MKKVMLASLALTALVAAPAMAADMRVRKAPPPPPPPIPVFTWTGCYVGGHIGGLWASKDWFFHEPGEPEFGFSEGGHDADGFLGGIQGGCDYQFGGPGGGFVIGIAADYAWANADGEHISILFPEERLHSEIESVASITGRLGWAVDRFLIYVKGGVAWERDKYHVRNIFVPESQWHAEETRTGFTLGFGGEFAFTNFLSAFVEANWYSFDDEELHFTSCCEDPFRERIEEDKFVVKGGFNFRFGGLFGKAPVAARY
jgi:outer membrane immunogenic protein